MTSNCGWTPAAAAGAGVVVVVVVLVTDWALKPATQSAGTERNSFSRFVHKFCI